MAPAGSEFVANTPGQRPTFEDAAPDSPATGIRQLWTRRRVSASM
jgi:hypothetical protein